MSRKLAATIILILALCQIQVCRSDEPDSHAVPTMPEYVHAQAGLEIPHELTRLEPLAFVDRLVHPYSDFRHLIERPDSGLMHVDETPSPSIPGALLAMDQGETGQRLDSAAMPGPEQDSGDVGSRLEAPSLPPLGDRGLNWADIWMSNRTEALVLALSLCLLLISLVTLTVLNVRARRACRKARQDQKTNADAARMLRDILDFLPGPVFIKDNDSRYILANKATGAIWGLKPEDVLGHTDEELGRIASGQTPGTAPNAGESTSTGMAREQASARQMNYQTLLAPWHGVVPLMKSNGEMDFVEASLLGLGVDVSNLVRGREASDHQHRLCELIARLATRLSHRPGEDRHLLIVQSLREVAQFLGADRAYLYVCDIQTERLHCLLSWQSEEISSQTGNPQDIPLSQWQSWLNSLGQTLHVAIDELSYRPDVALPPALMRDGLTSMATTPMMLGDECLGFIGFDSAGKLRSCSVQEMDMLRAFAQMLVNIREDIDHGAFSKQVRRDLLEIDSRFRKMLEDIPSMAVHGFDSGLTVTFWNEGSEKLYGWSREEAVGRSLLELIIPPSMQEHLQALIDGWANAGASIPPSEMLLHRRDGSPVRILANLAMQVDSNGAQQFYCLAVDVTIQAKAYARLELWSKLFKLSQDAIVLLDEEGRIIEFNAAFSMMTGPAVAENASGRYLEEILGNDPSVRKEFATIWHDVLQTGLWSGRFWGQIQGGRRLALGMSMTALHETPDNAAHYMAIMRDITNDLNEREQLEYIALYDPLTGLVNRANFRDRLRHSMSRCLQNQHTLAVAFIDLDGFKHINDEHGHDFGDDYLRAIANRLKATVRESDTVGRFGGDEFVLLLNNVGSQASHEHEAFNRIQKALSEPVSVHGRILPVSASIGVSLYPADNSCLDAEQLLRQADMAMYQGKHSGKGKLVVFKPEPVMEITERRH